MGADGEKLPLPCALTDDRAVYCCGETLMDMNESGPPLGSRSLDDWTHRWDLVDGCLKCRFCGWAQWPLQAEIPFTHTPDCPIYGPYDDFPWRDLMWIIEHAQSEAQK